MRRVISLVALCALVGSAWAATVREDQARLAARAWVSRGGTLGARLGAKVKNLSKIVCATAQARAANPPTTSLPPLIIPQKMV